MTVNNTATNERRLPLDGAPNIRDLGGYRTRDGGTTRWQKLLRGGRLSGLSAEDQQVLNALDIKVICDFRHPNEYQRDITKLSKQSSAAIHNISISPGNQQNLVDLSRIGASQMASWMLQLNRDLALNHRHSYREMFKLLLSVDSGSFLFHCSAGKDRTGFAAALILSALDVPRDVIMEDYLLTAQYYPPPGELEYLTNKYAAERPNVDIELFRTLTSTRQEYLAAAFAAIEEHYNSVDDYLERELDLSTKKREQLKQRYVE